MEKPTADEENPTLSNLTACAVDELSTISSKHHERIKLRHENGQYYPVLEGRFRNNLHFAVGFLELANAGDFAANVWNDVPVPIYAVVLMAIGATVAGIMSIFAMRDAMSAWHNIKFLRNQRQELKDVHSQRLVQSQTTKDIDVLLELNNRELGSESINRFGMDVLMGFGAVLICIGTYMAIGGANKKVWLASNILSGYLGNAPIAIYGLVNAAWAIILARNTRAHVRATRAALSGSTACRLVERRGQKVQLYCAINGTITILGGVSSMITATRWWGYTILAPVVVLSFVCNALWRTSVGYSHDESRCIPGISAEKLTRLLCFANKVKLKMLHDRKAVGDQLVREASTPTLALELIENCGLSEALCLKVLSDDKLRAALFITDAEEVEISIADILKLPHELHGCLVRTVQECVTEAGVRRFAHLERYNAELLGIYLHQCQQVGISSKR